MTSECSRLQLVKTTCGPVDTVFPDDAPLHQDEEQTPTVPISYLTGTCQGHMPQYVGNLSSSGASDQSKQSESCRRRAVRCATQGEEVAAIWSAGRSTHPLGFGWPIALFGQSGLYA
jgi:hypothetical protein